MRLSDFIDESNRADSVHAVRSLMERAAGDFGFDKYAYCALTSHDRYEAGDNPPPAVAHNFPPSWIDYYFDHGYQRKDPVVLLAPEIEGPFLWSRLGEKCRLNREQKILMEQARESGLNDGVGVPLHGPRGDVCLVTFAAGNGHSDPGAELGKLDVLAAQFHAAYSAIGRSASDRSPATALTVRERDCLQWIARGKCSWAIGAILNISVNTVNFHIKNAQRKLDSSTRTLAVVKAIRYGLINP